MKKLIEINDKDERDQKTTFFILLIEETDIVKIQNAIAETWKVKDYDVRTLKSNLDKITGIDYVYDCTLDHSNQVLELGF